MDECCAPRIPDGYEREFNARFARRLAKRYRSEGLTPSARVILDVAASIGLDGASLLEIGGGIGDIQLEALKHGASHTTNVELSPAYEPEATRLLDEAGLRDRATRMLGVDVARAPEAVERADIVVLHRVVCCYPDVARLLGAAADRGKRAVVFSYPVPTRMTRLSVRAINAWSALNRRAYRMFAHTPDDMVCALSARGFETRFRAASGPWRIVGAVRP